MCRIIFHFCIDSVFPLYKRELLEYFAILNENVSNYFTNLKMADFDCNTLVLENFYVYFAKSVELFYKFEQNDERILR